MLYKSTENETVKLDVQLIDRTVISVVLPQDFINRRDYRVSDFVKLRSVYLPELVVGSNKL